MNFRRVRGTKDYFSDEAEKLTYIINTLSSLVLNFNYKKIILPTFEVLDLFKRTLGNQTEIVNKEMFVFYDRKQNPLVLKPEGTASVVRAVLENKLIELGQKQKIFYIQNMFRYERPQKGRLREFYQLGVEIFNSNFIYDDIEILLLGIKILDVLNITKYKLEINSIGSLKTRNIYKKNLKEYFLNVKNKLSNDSREKLDKNIFRILDSKDQKDLNLIKKAPSISKYLTNDESQYFNKIKILLNELNIDYIVNDKLVRGLDYYNDLVFEFISLDEKNLGSKSTLIGGGRFDGLVEQIDNTKKVDAIGFAAGIERLMLAAKIELNEIKHKLNFVILTTDVKYNIQAIKIANQLRKKHIIETNLSTQSLTKKLSKAEREKAEKVIIIGKEIEEDIIIIKDLKKRTQKEINLKNLGGI